ncbi:MAG: hypothetical protein ABIE42_06415 [Candidatus Eisenbacteria bacterium]
MTTRAMYLVCAIVALMLVPSAGLCGDFGDAPEDGIAYPWLAVVGTFPTCLGGSAAYVSHSALGWSQFPGSGTPQAAFDVEADGNAGLCAGVTFPLYDQDECYQDGDAGLGLPPAYTIDNLGNIVPCTTTGSLAAACATAVWGVDIDMSIMNTMPVVGYFNALADWDHSGSWSGSSSCPGVGTAFEHFAVDVPVPIGYNGTVSGLPNIMPFLVGPNDLHVWFRFTVSESQVGAGWDGSGIFEDGETEDYLLLIAPDSPVNTASWGAIKALFRP